MQNKNIPTEFEKMEAWTKPLHVNCALNIRTATEEMCAILSDADKREIYPARVKDFVNDIERWCFHLKNHLEDSITEIG